MKAAVDSQPMLDRKPLLLLMDGHAIAHRAWHAIREPLNVRATGEDVRAVFGFLNIFLKTLSDNSPTHIAVAFDVSAPTFRHERFADYKAHRPPTPPELRPQFNVIKEVMTAFRVPIYEQAGIEADDVLGTLCKQAEEQDIDTVVLTGDTDTLQLVSSRVSVLLSHAVGNRTLYDVESVRERYGGLGPGVGSRDQGAGGRLLRQHSRCPGYWAQDGDKAADRIRFHTRNLRAYRRGEAAQGEKET